MHRIGAKAATSLAEDICFSLHRSIVRHNDEKMGHLLIKRFNLTYFALNCHQIKEIWSKWQILETLRLQKIEISSHHRTILCRYSGKKGDVLDFSWPRNFVTLTFSSNSIIWLVYNIGMIESSKVYCTLGHIAQTSAHYRYWYRVYLW